MFSHIMIGSNDVARSKKFYDGSFAAKGGCVTWCWKTREGVAYSHNGGRFMISKPIDGKPATSLNGGTIGFVMSDAGNGRGVAQRRRCEWRHVDRGSAWQAPKWRLSRLSS